jgi:hypothetical protein
MKANVQDFEAVKNYQEYLNYYSLIMIDGRYSRWSILEQAQKEFQEKWPGNYQVEEFYNSKKLRFGLRLKFQDPKEEVVWLLRWS